MTPRLQLVLVKGSAIGYATADQVMDYIESNDVCTIEIDDVEEIENGNTLVNITPFSEEALEEFNQFVVDFMSWLYN